MDEGMGEDGELIPDGVQSERSFYSFYNKYMLGRTLHQAKLIKHATNREHFSQAMEYVRKSMDDIDAYLTDSVPPPVGGGRIRRFRPYYERSKPKNLPVGLCFWNKRQTKEEILSFVYICLIGSTI